jgi:protein-S-isoprenylcysteine O-methyltransferase Ste14
MYVGFILMCVASCLYVPHPINFALAAVMVVVHHVVVIREEEYLDANHQEEWRAYRSRVRRYL